VGIEWITVTTPYGEAWRTARRLLHSHMHQGVVRKYQPFQIMSARKLSQEVLAINQEVGAVSHIVQSYFGRMMMKMTYGIESEKVASEQLSLADEYTETTNTILTPGRFLVDIFTFCEFLFAFRDLIRNHWPYDKQ
jgi:cytochrome P450